MTAAAGVCLYFVTLPLEKIIGCDRNTAPSVRGAFNLPHGRALSGDPAREPGSMTLYVKAERQASLDWLKAALSPMSAQAGRRDVFHGIMGKYHSLKPVRSKIGKGKSDSVNPPRFTANNAAWRVVSRRNATNLTVAPRCSIRGNYAWCDLPFSLSAKSACRLKIKWRPCTTGGGVNLHIRNAETGKFRVIGTVEIKGWLNLPRTDTVDFLVPGDGFSQFMLGAVHFSGPHAGAKIASISVEEIPFAAVRTVKKAPGLAEKALEMAVKDNERFVNALAQGMASQGIGGARARLMFHAHAIEKGLSRSDFRAGFGKIAVPNLAKEMNSWLAAGRDTTDQFFRTGASVMQVYFRRHRDLGVDVSEFQELFGPDIQELVANADKGHGGVLAAASEREEVATGQDRNLLDVVYGRRSIREFTSAPVRDEDIRRAVQIAMQAPSVCNRQAGRVHQFDDPRVIKAALGLQGGFNGYPAPPRLLLVTCDLTSFLFAAERNQPFIDGGLFMMTLLLGLQQVGLGSCSLNTAMNPERENAIRKILGIPDNEIFIAFVAVGHYDPTILTPQSKRISVDEVLVPHRGDRV